MGCVPESNRYVKTSKAGPVARPRFWPSLNVDRNLRRSFETPQVAGAQAPALVSGVLQVLDMTHHRGRETTAADHLSWKVAMSLTSQDRSHHDY